ncbi:MAG TPA: HWE histidine kinase domain-containing protein [Methylocella sp.]|nr:HWE histidine kinase domain-containing protein [Methylocella sp.]
MERDFFDRLLASESQFQLWADLMPQLIWLARPDGWIYWYNRKCYDYTGAAPGTLAGWGWQAVIDPAALPDVLIGWKGAIASGEPFEMVFPLRAADASFRPFLALVQPVKDGQGQVLRWLGTNTDIAEQQRAEEHLKLLLNELNHRVRNTLATVQAIARLSLSSLPTETVETFLERVVALARAHDLLMQKNWRVMDLHEIIDRSIEPLCAERGKDRLAVDGPTVLIPAERAASWSMALHELCTNAIKHGAFKTDLGKVTIDWDAPSEGLLHFRWREQGGPTVHTPQHRGFGSRLIESLGRELSGEANLSFEPAGLVCTIDAPIGPVPTP